MPDKVVTVKLLAQTGQYTTQMAAAAKTTQSFAANVAQSTSSSARSIQSFSTAAAKFGKVVTIGVAGGLALSAKAALDFESSFTGVRKTLDATPGQFATLRDQIRGLAKEIPVSVNELNRIAELGGQLGISVRGVEGFTDTIAKLGVTTTLQSEAAAQGLARLANILGFSEGEFENFGSALVDLGNNFATTEDQILTFALRIAPVGSTIGLTADDVLALSTAFSSVGVPAERGGTAVQRTFISMAEAVITGRENLETFAKVAGTTSEEFKELFERDAAQALNIFLQGLNDLDAAGGNVFATLDDVGLGSQRTVQALLALANADGILTDALNMSENAWRSNLALQEEADLRFETTASKITLAKNQINDLGISIGEGLLPVLGLGAETLGDFIAGIDALGPVGKSFIAVILGATAGLVTFNKVGKLITNTFGIKVPAAMAASTAGTVAFQAALGLGLVAALTGVIALVANFGRKAEESRARVESLTDAMIELREGAEGVDLGAVIEGGLTPQDKELLDEIGISYGVFAEAAAGGAEALELFNTKLAEYQAGAERAGSGIAEGQTILDFDTLRNTEDALDLLTRGTEEYNDALRKSNDILAQEGMLENMKAQAEGYDNLVDKMIQVEIAARKSGDAVDGQADSFDAAAEEAELLADALSDIDDELDASFSFVDSVNALAEALAEVEDEAEPTFDQLNAITQAMVDVERAARDLGPDGIQPMLENLERARQMGLLTEAQYQQLLETLLLIDPVAQAFGQGSAIITANLDSLGSVAANTGVPISGLINLLIGLNSAMAATITNAEQMTLALDLAINKQGKLKALNFLPGEDAASQLGGIPLATVNEIKRRFDALSGAFIDIGGEISGAIGAGIKSGGSGGGGSIEDVVEEELEDAIEAAQRQMDVLFNAIEATLSKEQSIQDLIDAEQELNDLLEEQATLPDKIREAEEKLAAARKAAAETTLEELLDIQIAEENLARARIAFEQGRISQVELQIAEKELADARKAATADTEDVKDAEEELEELRQREIDIARDIRDAELELLEAKLDLIQAELDLAAAGRDYNKVGEEGIKIFQQWGDQVGLTMDSIKELLALAEGAGLLVAGGIPGGGTLIPAIDDSGIIGGGGGTGNDQYIVQSGDTLSKIANQLGVSLSHLIGLNASVFNQNSQQTRNLDPNILFPGDLLQYHFGGTVSGFPGTPQLAVLKAGEHVSSQLETKKMHEVGMRPVMIQNLHVKGVFDPTRPGEWNKIMRVVRDDLEYDRRSRTVI